jgi:hypothetical protein
MGSFQRAFLGYRRPEVDAAILARDIQLELLKQQAAEHAELETELTSLSGMVIEREREIRNLTEQLLQANERHERSIGSLEAISARLGEIEAQARGQATRIRMKALHEAVEVGRRAQELAEVEAEVEPAPADPKREPANFNGNGEVSQETFEGTIQVEVGPLGDYSQLVGIEDAIGRMGASEISIQRFSEGRATLSMNLDEPVDVLRRLEEHSSMEFRVRHAADDSLVLDVDDDDQEHHAA